MLPPKSHKKGKDRQNLAKLDCDLDQSPTVMVGETHTHTQKKLGKNRSIPNPSWDLVETQNSMESDFLRIFPIWKLTNSNILLV